MLRRRIDVEHVARAARILSSSTRLRVLLCLTEREASVSDLATTLGVAQPLLSRHLGVLRRNGVVRMRYWRRLYLYGLDGTRVTTVLALLHQFPRTRTGPLTALPRLRRRGGSDLRKARSCYDHLAGGAGVYLLAELLRRRWLVEREEGDRPAYDLSARGAQALFRRRVNVLWARRSTRRFAYGCPDWSPSHRHLGGAVGAALLDALLKAGVVRPARGSRRLIVRRSLGTWLGPERQRRGSLSRMAGSVRG